MNVEMTRAELLSRATHDNVVHAFSINPYEIENGTGYAKVEWHNARKRQHRDLVRAGRRHFGCRPPLPFAANCVINRPDNTTAMPSQRNPLTGRIAAPNRP